MSRKAPLLLLLLALVAGCSNTIRHTVSTEYYRLKPRTVALLPVEWEGAAAGAKDGSVSLVFNEMAAEKMRSLGYGVTVVGEDEWEGKGSGAEPSELARRFGTETVLYSRITEWDTDTLATYAALTLNARFDLYSANGERLWAAEHESKKSDIRLDTAPLKMAVIDAWEPKVQRYIDIVFATLPRSEAPGAAEERFFDWLP